MAANNTKSCAITIEEVVDYNTAIKYLNTHTAPDSEFWKTTAKEIADSLKKLVDDEGITWRGAVLAYSHGFADGQAEYGC